MTENKSITELRREAEKKLARLDDLPSGATAADVQKLVQELRVHQIELEMQNAQLAASQADLEKSRKKYSDLYDFAPVGYLSFDENGLIVEANLAIATLLGTERRWMISSPFQKYIVVEDRDAFRLHLLKLSQTRERDRCEVKLRAAGGHELYVQLDSLYVEDSEGKTTYRTAVTDITERKRMEEQLSQSKARLEAIFNSISEGLVFADTERRIVSINPAATRLFGYTLEELQGKTSECLYASRADYEEAGKRRYNPNASSEQPLFETTYRRKDGTLFPAESVGTAVRDEKGNHLGYVAIHQDITQRKRAEEELRKAHRELEMRVRERTAELAKANEVLREQASLLELAHDAIIVCDLDDRILYWNEGARKTYGWSKEEASGKVAHTLLQTRFPKSFQDITSDVLTTGQWEGELHIVARNGAQIVVTSRWALQRDDMGRPKATLKISRDITERKKTEEELKKSERLLRIVMDTLPLGVWVVDKEGEIIIGNPASQDIWGGARYVGIDRYDQYKAWWADTGQRIKPEEWAAVRAIRKGETSLNEVVEIERFDGECRTILNSAVPIFDAKREILGAIVVNQDISEKRRAERRLNEYMAKLQESNQALQDFASIASHDMQEPLRKIKSFGEQLKNSCGESLGERGLDYLERMQNAANRMDVLLHALLDYARVSTKTEPFSSVDLTRLVHEVISDLEIRIAQTGGRVEVASLPTLKADPNQMRQLFQNLLANGLKFHRADEPPVIRVSGQRTANGGYEILVEDNGIGFDEKYIDRIFAPFQRLHGRSEYEGTGMGLAICRKIVERHGGCITAKSAKGKGSVFVITLPQSQPRES